MKTLAFLHQPGEKSRQTLRDTLGDPWVREIQWYDRCDALSILSALKKEAPDVVIALGHIARRGLHTAIQAYTGRVHAIVGKHPSGRGGNRISPTHQVLESLKRIRVELDMWRGGTWK